MESIKAFLLGCVLLTLSSNAYGEDEDRSYSVSEIRVFAAKCEALLGANRYDIREGAAAAIRKENPALVVKAIPYVLKSSDPEVVYRGTKLLPDLIDNLDHTDAGAFVAYRTLFRERPALVDQQTNNAMERYTRRVLKDMEKIGIQCTPSSRSFTRIHHISFPKRQSKTEISESALSVLGSFDSAGELRLANASLANGRLDILRAIPRLDRLYFDGHRIADGEFKVVERYKDLTHLSLMRVNVLDDMFPVIAKLKKLESLGLDETQVNDSQLAKLKDLENLRSIWLNNADISDKGLATLARHKKLEKLVLAECKGIDGSGFEQLKECKNLNSLSLMNCPLSDENGVHLKGFTKLKTLGLDGTGVGDATVQSLNRMTAMEQLWLNQSKITDKSFVAIGAMRNLKKLVLADCRNFSGSGFSQLKRCVNLAELYLENCKIENESTGHLPGIFGLKKLVLTNNPITDECLKGIAGCRNLNILSLSNCKIEGDGIEDLGDCSNLTELALKNCPISDEHAEGLSRLTKVRILWLDGTKIGNGAIYHLGQLARSKRIVTLGLESTNITDSCIDDLTKLKSLRTLDVRNTKITTTGMEKIAKQLPKCRLLK